VSCSIAMSGRPAHHHARGYGCLVAGSSVRSATSLLALVCVGSVLGMHGLDAHAGLHATTTPQHHVAPHVHGPHHGGHRDHGGDATRDADAPSHAAHVGALCLFVVLVALGITRDDRCPQRLAPRPPGPLVQAISAVDPPVPRLGLAFA
jgi:hypothetical protein